MKKQKALTFLNRGTEEAQREGYPTFNKCNHYVVDMSHLDPRTEDWMNTISLKLPNGLFATLCVMQTSKDEICIDTKFHGDNLKEHRVYAIGEKGEGTSVYNKNIYALIAHSKGQ